MELQQQTKDQPTLKKKMDLRNYRSYFSIALLVSSFFRTDNTYRAKLAFHGFCIMCNSLVIYLGQLGNLRALFLAECSFL
jgi:hypothetical protein